MKSPLANIAQQERTRREILHKSDLIPPLPELVVRLLALLNNQDTEPNELEEHLRNDQVLVAKILAMVNSPFYGLNRSVTDIREAIMVLGFRGLRSLILASSTATFMAQDYSCYGHNSKGLWKHALAVGTGARCIAIHCEFEGDTCEELFVAGLLHDIGKMLIAPYLNHAGSDVRGSSGVPSTDPSNRSSDTSKSVVEVEREIVGLDHTEAGALVAAKWNLSNTVQEVLVQHHDIGTPAKLVQEVAVVRLADAFAHERGVGYLPGLAPHGTSRTGDLDALNLTRGAWEQFCVGLNDMVQNSLDKLAKITS